jgi:mRNA interferase MazF
MTMICETFDVVEVPFPFSDKLHSKIRKALVLTPKSFNKPNGATTLMMITSGKNSEWVGDTALTHWKSAGLLKPCYVRLKFFTLDNGLISKKVGELSAKDKDSVKKAVRKIIPFA